MNVEQARFNMVEQQIRPWEVLDQNILDLLKGDATAGAVLVKVATLDGQAVIHERRFDLDRNSRVWQVMAQGAEPDMDALLTRARRRDPDLWIIEIEDRAGRSLLEEGGLSD